MAKREEKEIERWVTVNGARVPIFKDGSVGGPKALRDKIKAGQDKKKESGKKESFVVDFDIQKAFDKKEAKRAKSHEAYMKKKQRNIEAAKRAFEAGEDTPRSKAEAKVLLNKYTDKKSGSKERLSVYERQLAEVNDELANAPKSKALRNEEGIRELEKKKAQLEGYIAKEKGTSAKNEPKKSSYEEHEKEYQKTGKVEGYIVSQNEDGQHIFKPRTSVEKELERAKEYKQSLLNEHNNTKSRFKAKPSDFAKADEKIKELEQTLKDGKDKYVTDKQTKAQKTIQANEDLKEKQIKQNKAERDKLNDTKSETVEQAMDRLQKESRAKVDSMSAQQVMKYAKENGLRGLKTDTLAQRDDRVANHMYMQEMKKWRAEKDKLNGKSEPTRYDDNKQFKEWNTNKDEMISAYMHRYNESKEEAEQDFNMSTSNSRKRTLDMYRESQNNKETYKKEYKNPDAYFSAVSVAERALEQKTLSKLEPLPYFSKEARQRDKDIANGKYRTRITDVSRLSLSDLRTVAQSLGKKTEGKSKAELVAMIEKIFKKG